MSERRFSPEHAERILARAAEIEDDTLSASELERIAAEVGIGPSHVRRAIAEKDRALPSSPFVLGAPTRLSFESEIPRVLSDAEIERARSSFRGLSRTTVTISRLEHSTVI